MSRLDLIGAFGLTEPDTREMNTLIVGRSITGHSAFV
jgi:hypothetical protein